MKGPGALSRPPALRWNRPRLAPNLGSTLAKFPPGLESASGAESMRASGSVFAEVLLDVFLFLLGLYYPDAEHCCRFACILVRVLPLGLLYLSLKVGVARSRRTLSALWLALHPAIGRLSLPMVKFSVEGGSALWRYA